MVIIHHKIGRRVWLSFVVAFVEGSELHLLRSLPFAAYLREELSVFEDSDDYGNLVGFTIYLLTVTG
jgi:hypothetical protein